MPVVNTLSASLDGSATQLVPTGAILSYAGSSAPAGWLVCDGQAVSRTTYANLFSALGTTFGTGDGSTTFNLPDLRGRFIRYDDNMGSHGISGVSSTGAAGRDTSRAHGSAQGQATAKNGLTATAAASSVSINKNQWNSDQIAHSHTLNGQYLYPKIASNYTSGSYGVEAVTNPSTTSATATWNSVNATGTAAAQTITIGAGDAETRPINLALNAIIKI